MKPPCTFLVPIYLVRFLRKRQRDFGTVADYLRFLLTAAPGLRRRNHLPNINRVTRRYQPAGQHLVSVNARIPGEVWTELRCLAGGSGVTMCRMFVRLLEIDEAGGLFTEGAPTESVSNYRFEQGIDRSSGVTERHTWIYFTRAPPD